MNRIRVPVPHGRVSTGSSWLRISHKEPIQESEFSHQQPSQIQSTDGSQHTKVSFCSRGCNDLDLNSLDQGCSDLISVSFDQSCGDLQSVSLKGCGDSDSSSLAKIIVTLTPTLRKRVVVALISITLDRELLDACWSLHSHLYSV